MRVRAGRGCEHRHVGALVRQDRLLFRIRDRRLPDEAGGRTVVIDVVQHRFRRGGRARRHVGILPAVRPRIRDIQGPCGGLARVGCPVAGDVEREVGRGADLSGPFEGDVV